MKKKLAIILAIIMCVSVVFTSCDLFDTKDSHIDYSKWVIEDKDYVKEQLDKLKIDYTEDDNFPAEIALEEKQEVLDCDGFEVTLAFNLEDNDKFISYNFVKRYDMDDEDEALEDMEEIIKLAKEKYKEVDEDDVTQIKPSSPYSKLDNPNEFYKNSDKNAMFADIYYIPSIAKDFGVEIGLSKVVEHDFYVLDITYSFLSSEIQQ